MIKTWSLEHFKSVYEKTNFELAPLTIFTGANSSGKSTVLQSILLTAQTVQNSVLSKSIILNGHIIKLGTFNDILSDQLSSNDISIGFQLDSSSLPSFNRNIFRFGEANKEKEIENPFVNCEFTFNSREKNINDVSQLHPELVNIEINLTEKNEQAKQENKILINKSDKDPEQRLKELNVNEGNKNDLSYEVEVSYQQGIFMNPLIYRREGPPVSVSLKHFLPDKIIILYDKLEAEGKWAADEFIDWDNDDYPPLRIPNRYQKDKFIYPTAFKTIVLNEIKEVLAEENKIESTTKELQNNGVKVLSNDFNADNYEKLLRNLSAESRKKLTNNLKNNKKLLVQAYTKGKEIQKLLLPAPLPDNIEAATDSIQSFFNSYLKYLGPLRDEPKPVYPHSGVADSKDVGFKGEHTAAVLEVHKETIVEYLLPDDLSKGLNTKPRKGTLLEAVLIWLEYMGVVNDVQTFDRGKLGHELKVVIDEGNSFHDLTNVGVGVSQVLPILVLSFLSSKGSTLIFEQPELHLHPRVQTRLADFFVSMTQLGKQCIVESHSEYLINRLRYRSAISNDKSIAESVTMYFVEKIKGKSQYKTVKMNEYGVIEDWPKGFFDENEENSAAILRAAMKKRKKRQETHD